MDEVLAAARWVQALALEQGLIDEPLTESEGPATASPLAARGYLGLLRAAREAGRVPRLDVYLPDCFTESETIRAEGAVGWIDAYRLALDAADRLAAVDCREVAYLNNLASGWRYEDDEGLVDVGRMCDIISLFSWFLYLYRELEPDNLAGWERANAGCVATNRELDALDGGAARAAALDVIGRDEID